VVRVSCPAIKAIGPEGNDLKTGECGGVARYRHYRNWAEQGEASFVTTTLLDFNHAFARPEVRERMVRSLVEDSLHYGAILHAFVVMPHHVHFFTGLAGGRTIGWLVQRIKSNGAKAILPMLTERELAGFDIAARAQRPKLLDEGLPKRRAARPPSLLGQDQLHPSKSGARGAVSGRSRVPMVERPLLRGGPLRRVHGP
jgi:REP element-mobilizing transposase RayT